MILNIFQILLTIATFVGVKYIAYKVTDEYEIPMFLRYKPYICYTCLGFWSLMSIFLTFGFILHLWITMGVGMTLTALDAIAQKIHQKNNTVKIEDI